MIKTQILESIVEPSAPSSTDYRGSREASSQIVVDLVQDGTLKSGAQTVVVVVREFTSFPFGAFSGEDDDVEDDDD
jgi:hypothetical protein